MKSWKIGAVSGLIAGIVAGLIAVFITVPLHFKLGIPYWWLPPPPDTPFMKIAMTEITFNIIWGIFLGIIYSRIQDLIPGKGVLKGLIFGLGYYFITSIRLAILAAPYGKYAEAIGLLLFIGPIIYGLVLGMLYRAPKEKLVARKHEIMRGIKLGVITGIILGIAVEITLVLSAYFGATFGFMETFPDYLTDIGFIIGQWGSHILINMILWGFMGAFYVMFYDRIPGKGIIKGCIFGLAYYLITGLRLGLICLAYGSLSYALWMGLIMPDVHIFAGLLLEGFYKKRSRAFLIAGIFFIIGIIRSMIPLG
jgi:hypothetical protein